MKHSLNINLIKSPDLNNKLIKFTHKISKFLSDLILIFSVLFICEESDEIKKSFLNTKINNTGTVFNTGTADLNKKY